MEKKFGFGIIGTGNIAKFHADCIEKIPNAILFWVLSKSQSRADQVAKNYKCPVFWEMEKLLSHPEIDIICVCNESGLHGATIAKIAKAGKHILCEKPLETTVEKIDRIAEVVKSTGIQLACVFQNRENPEYKKLKTFIESGSLGKILLCQLSINWYRPPTYYEGSWRGTKALDGGAALINQGIHTIDLLLYLAGPVKRVSASMALLTHENIEVEDTAVAILEFENGARGVIQGSTSCWSSTGHPAEIQICGSEGSAFLSDESFRVWDFKTINDQDDFVKNNLMQRAKVGLGANDPNAINNVGHLRNFENVIHALENDTTPLISGAEAIKSVQLICAIYESANNQGKWINV